MRTDIARPMLGLALALGAAADLLVRDGPGGAGFALWIAALAVGTATLGARVGRRVPAESLAWLTGAALFATAMVWRSSDVLQALDLLATALCLAMAAVAVRDPDWSLRLARVRDAIWPLTAVARTTAAGILPVVFHIGLASRPIAAGQHRLGATARAALLSAMLLALFGALLLHADPLFANLLAIPPFDVALFFSHLAVIAFFAWIVAGWSRSAFDDTSIARAPEQFGFRLTSLDITMSLSALNILFAAFVGVQLAWLFGGDAYLQAHTGLTAAAYARRGFFELVWVAMLVIPLLLGSRAVIDQDPAIRRRHSLLSVPLTVLLGAIMLSAALRMRLYVMYYGLTIDRFYAMVFMAWLAAVIALIAMTVLRDRGRRLLAGAALSGFGTLVALNLASPDRVVARVNLDRAAAGTARDAAPLDIVHLSSLGGDAVELAVAAVVSNTSADSAGRCKAARLLLRRWGSESQSAIRQSSEHSWRRGNAGQQRGLAAVDKASGDLQAVVGGACSEPH